jgi:hypothetical protein
MALTEQDLLAIKGVVHEVVKPQVDALYSHVSKTVSECALRHTAALTTAVDLHKATCPVKAQFNQIVDQAKGVGIATKVIWIVLSILGGAGGIELVKSATTIFGHR